jgi:hypothetical protein
MSEKSAYLKFSSMHIELNTEKSESVKKSESESQRSDEYQNGNKSPMGRRYKLVAPPSLSPPPFTDMPERKHAHNIGGDVYASASWWTDDQNDEEVKSSINWQHAQSKMKKVVRSFYPKVKEIKEFVPDFEL